MSKELSFACSVDVLWPQRNYLVDFVDIQLKKVQNSAQTVGKLKMIDKDGV